MMLRHEALDEPMSPAAAQAPTAVRSGTASLADIERRLAPCFVRAEPRRRALAYLRGLLSSAERKNSWQLAELSGETTPYGFQYVLSRADWAADAVRDELRKNRGTFPY